MKLSAAQQKKLLQKEELIIAPHVQRGQPKNKRLTLKNCLTGSYLNVSEKQLDILARFREGKSVPEVLNELIRNSKSPALVDFYELILKAFIHQILKRKADAVPEKEVLHVRLPLLRWWVFLPLLLAGCGFALWTMWEFPLVFVRHWGDVALGFLVASLSLSLGQVLAGGVIRYFGGAVHRPKLRLLAIPPYVSFDLRDARLIQRSGAVLVGLARLMPFLPALGVVQIYQPTLAVPLLFLFLLHLFPSRGSAVDQILQGLTGRVALDIYRHKIFYLQERSFLGKLSELMHEDLTYALMRYGFLLLWGFALGLLAYLAFYDYFFKGISTSLIVYFSLWLFSFVGLAYPLFILWRDVFSVRKERNKIDRKFAQIERERSVFDLASPPPATELQNFLAEVPICHPLTDKEIQILSKYSKFIVFENKAIIFDERDPDENLLFLFTGTVDVFRSGGWFGKSKLDRLTSGASLGKTPNWNAKKAPRWYLSRGRTSFLVAKKGETQELDQVLKKIYSTRAGVYLGFLGRTPPFANWSSEVLQLIVKESTVITFKKGQKILQMDKANKFFYIVYQGTLSTVAEKVRRKRKRILKAGDFFGELSALRNALPAGDVVGEEEGECLALAKSNFIWIATQHPEVILTFEKHASQTLGFPIFPVSEATARIG
ncbi:MAG: cyclic nucleotide-binding domain-containing protein [Opitutales bacterium]|nr:cyclic nucleotide-binding domain-containing protein [Opitutales bacterium]MCH8539865.1 cyclic nucleotide-binding domain-containing protein [Opitutales bacterium]